MTHIETVKEVNKASKIEISEQFNDVIAAVERVLEHHRIQIENLYSTSTFCPTGSIRFGPQVHPTVSHFTNFLFFFLFFAEFV